MKISTANSRFATVWRNTDMTWAQLRERLMKTTRTAESVSAYRALSKTLQDKIKDVGGFVGGWLKDGKRRSDSVLCRSMLTLDLDYAAVDFWESFTIFNDLAAICYSTHKHTPEAPRLRLLVPLSREVLPDEYEAVARKLAEELGIDQFDDTTYQASRLMYWPSTSQDGEYFFQVQEGPELDVDAYLAKYADWRDVTSWPVSSRQTLQLRKHASKAEDPLQKEGVIGAFCRAYSIQAAIEEFLSDVYHPNPRGDRYTYLNGSTANGLVVYDNKFAYSNHSTDPAGGKLCNAFDLVRIHKFGELDTNLSSGSNQAIAKQPSFKAMTEWAAKQDKVKAELVGATTAADGWMAKLRLDRHQQPELTLPNLALIVANDVGLKDRLRMNELTHQPEAHGELPWGYSGQLREEDDAQLKKYVEDRYGLYHGAKLQEAVLCEADDHRYHPIRDYLHSLPEWDEIPRVETLLIDYLGAEDNSYVRAVTRKTLVAAIARVLDPGCKFDYMLTLVGPQGVGKSSLIRALGGDWYIGLESGISGKESVEQLQGRWIVEVEELSSLKKAEVEQIKTYLSKQEEQVRMAYARRSALFKRQNVFIGTTNNRNFLRDLTGNRRFWVVDITRGQRRLPNPDDQEECAGWRAQIWAEALVLYREGEKRYLDSDELDELAAEAQEEHMETDPWIGMIDEYVSRDLPVNWSELELFDRRAWLQDRANVGEVERDRVCALEIWCECLDGRREMLSTYDAMRINQILDRLEGWERQEGPRQYGGAYGKQRGFRKIK